MAKTIKLFDGIKITTSEEVKKYPDMTVFDEAVKCSDEQKGDIIRLLLIQHTVDLSKFTADKSRCILDLYTDKGAES
jgi:hypothetical protein